MIRIHRSDKSQGDIVNALRRVGCAVWVLGRPCDLLVRFRGVNWLLDCGRTQKSSKRDAKQVEAFATFAVQIVYTPEEALKAIGAL